MEYFIKKLPEIRKRLDNHSDGDFILGVAEFLKSYHSDSSSIILYYLSKEDHSKQNINECELEWFYNDYENLYITKKGNVKGFFKKGKFRAVIEYESLISNFDVITEKYPLMRDYFDLEKRIKVKKFIEEEMNLLPCLRGETPNFYLYQYRDLGIREIPVKLIVGGSVNEMYGSDWVIKKPEEFRYKRLVRELELRGLENKQNTLYEFGYIDVVRIYSLKKNMWVYYVDSDGHRRTSIAHSYGIAKIKARVGQYSNKMTSKDMVKRFRKLNREIDQFDRDKAEKFHKIVKEQNHLEYKSEEVKELRELYELMKTKIVIKENLNNQSLMRILHKNNRNGLFYGIFYLLGVISKEEFSKSYKECVKIGNSINVLMNQRQ